MGATVVVVFSFYFVGLTFCFCHRLACKLKGVGGMKISPALQEGGSVRGRQGISRPLI